MADWSRDRTRTTAAPFSIASALSCCAAEAHCRKQSLVAMLPSTRSSRARVASEQRLADDPCWVEQLKAGDGAGLRAAYELNHRAVRAFARRVLGEEHAAEDLVQDVFLALPSLVKNFRAEGSAESFLLGIASNKVRHYVRRAQRRRSAYGSLASEPRVAGSPLADAELAKRQLAQQLQEALLSLKLEYRTAFVLCELEERSSSEVARILGCPASTIRERVRVAREQLRKWARREGLE